MRKLRAIVGLAVVVAVAATATSIAVAKPSSGAKAAAAAKALIKCGKVRGLGLMAPITGPAASLGGPQYDWVKFWVAQYNKTHKKTKFRIQAQDTMLGAANGTAEALKGAQALAANPLVLGVVGPAGSNEVVGTTDTLKRAGLAFVTGSATRTTLSTDGTRVGYFYRVVPPDAQQSLTVSGFMVDKLKVKKVYIIDDQEAYSTGLADEVQSQLKAKGVSVSRDGVSQQQSDFSSLIAKIPNDTDVVYLPWQLPPKGQAFGQQMKAAGKGNIKLMGSDGLFDPAFASVGSNVYDSFFPLNPADKTFAAFTAQHGGDAEYFGAPSYEAADVIGKAIDRACADGTATRAEVRKQLLKTNENNSLLGLPVRFAKNGDLVHGVFGVYQSKNGKFARVG